MRFELEDYIEKVNIDFSSRNLSQLIQFVGVNNRIRTKEESMKRFVFLGNETDEVYSPQEISFINSVKSVFCFSEEKKKTPKGMMPCRFFAADLRDVGEDIYSAVQFMKIIIKAYVGWPMFILRLNDGMHVGMKVFGSDIKNNCLLCEKKTVYDVFDEFSTVVEDKDFLLIYSTMLETINPVDGIKLGFDEKIKKKRGVNYEYINELESISRELGVDMSNAINSYKQWFMEESIYSFKMEFEDTLDSLAYIKTSKVNTIEMLFEAEKLDSISFENSLKYNQIITNYDDDERDSVYTLDISNTDPEELIKLIKKEKGL